jgi:hypothetical protein
LYRIFFDPKIEVILITFLYLELFFSRLHRFLRVFEIRGVKKIRLSIIHPIHLKIYPSNPSISKNVG